MKAPNIDIILAPSLFLPSQILFNSRLIVRVLPTVALNANT